MTTDSARTRAFVRKRILELWIASEGSGHDPNVLWEKLEELYEDLGGTDLGLALRAHLSRSR